MEPALQHARRQGEGPEVKGGCRLYQAVFFLRSATVVSSGGCRRLYQAGQPPGLHSAAAAMYWAAVAEGTQYRLTARAVHTSHRYDSTHTPTQQNRRTQSTTSMGLRSNICSRVHRAQSTEYGDRTRIKRHPKQMPHHTCMLTFAEV